MIALLKKTAESIEGVTYLTAQKSEANKLMDMLHYPAIIAFPLGGKETIQGFKYQGSGNTDYNYSILFLFKSELPDSHEQHELYLEQAEALRKNFIYRLSKEQSILDYFNLSFSFVLNYLDSNASGVELSLGIRLSNDYEYACYTPERIFDGTFDETFE